MQYNIDENGILRINDNVKEIEPNMFEESDRLKATMIIVPSSVKIIKTNGLSNFFNVRKIDLPNSIVEMEENAFANNEQLVSIKLPNKIKSIRSNSFKRCKSLENIAIPDGVEELDESVFVDCKKLKNINLPQSVVKIRSSCFFNCESLEQIRLPKNLKLIEEHTFNGCKQLKYVEFNENLIGISQYAFSKTKIEEVKFKSDLQWVASAGFAYCDRLKKVEFPDSLKNLGKDGVVLSGVFTGCKCLETVSCPMNSEIGIITYAELENIDNFLLRYQDEEYPLSDIEVIEDVQNEGRVVRLNNGDVFLISKDYSMRLTQKELLVRKTKWNDLQRIRPIDYFKLLNWNKFSIVPHKIVVENLPKREIPNFYLNNNMANWKDIVKSSGVTDSLDKEILFKLAHALGVFSENGKESQIATEYLKALVKTQKYHDNIREFYNFDSYNTPYNSQFAKFFMKYFTTQDDFLISKDVLDGRNISFLVECHDKFNQVLKIYPNKKILTRQDSERLTPQLVLSAVIGMRYSNVNKNAVELAEIASRFNISQKEFELLQNWFLEGLKVKNSMILKIAPDVLLEKKEVDQNFISYEFLDKSSPLGAVLGNITNCCQTVSGWARSCLEHGMTQTNSGFVVFKNAQDILGMSWVWFDKETKQITLDNIEVPNIWLAKIKASRELQYYFCECLNRLVYGIELGMGTENISRITIGKGYNDIKYLLSKYYPTYKSLKGLTGYSGYTDAIKTGQYMIKEYPLAKELKDYLMIEKEKSE